MLVIEVLKPAVEAGVLAGILQGQPVEPLSPYDLHLETSHIISRRDEARAQRRALNADVEALRTLVQRLNDRISADLDRLPEPVPADSCEERVRGVPRLPWYGQDG